MMPFLIAKGESADVIWAVVVLILVLVGAIITMKFVKSRIEAGSHRKRKKPSFTLEQLRQI